jgi:hypothetical protein
MATVKKIITFDHPEPTENPSPDWSMVLNMARAKFAADRDLKCDPKDIENYIFEGVMTAVYGEGFWEWSNERIEFKE